MPFPHVTADTLVFVLHKAEVEQDHQIEVSEFGKPLMLQPQSDFHSSAEHTFSSYGNEDFQMLINTMQAAPKVEQLKFVCDSTSGFGGKSNLIVRIQTDQDQIPVLKGDSIGRYEMHQNYWFPFKKDNITGRTTNLNKLGSSPKILLRKTGDRIIATFDESRMFPEQSLYFLYNNRTSLNMKYILGVLNSSVMTMYYRIRPLTNKDTIAQVKKVDLDQLPIPVLDLSLPADRKIHDDIVMLVTRMLELHSHPISPRTPHDQHALQRQIRMADDQINLIVRKLFQIPESDSAASENDKSPFDVALK